MRLPQKILYFTSLLFLICCNKKDEESNIKIYLKKSNYFFSNPIHSDFNSDRKITLTEVHLSKQNRDSIITFLEDVVRDSITIESSDLMCNSKLSYNQALKVYLEGKKKQSHVIHNVIQNKISKVIQLKNNLDTAIEIPTSEFLLFMVKELKGYGSEWIPLEFFAPYPKENRVTNYTLKLEHGNYINIIDTSASIVEGDYKAEVRYAVLTKSGLVYSDVFHEMISIKYSTKRYKQIIDSLKNSEFYYFPEDKIH